MPNKVNGASMPGQHLVGSLQFFRIETAEDIRPTTEARVASNATTAAAAQAKLDRIIEVISMAAQPVVIGAVTGTAPASVLQFAVEHANVWGKDDATQQSTLATALAGIAGTVTVTAVTF